MNSFLKWLEFVKNKHNNFYDYSLVEYKNQKTKVKIICPIHGIFKQTPDSHKKNGCPECGKINSHNKQKLTQEDFLNKMKKIHKFLDFSNSKYVNVKTPVEVRCLVCNNIFQKSPNELCRNGCPFCSNNKRQKTLKNIRYKKALQDINIILEKCNIELLDKYKGKYKIRCQEWKRYNFKCKKCGYIFVDFLDNQHLPLCPICNPGKLSSKGELEIRKYIMDNYPQLKIIPNDRIILEGKEIDVLIPELKIGFEYDGIYWHKNKEEYDKNKDELAKQKGITIYHIKEKRTKKEKENNLKEVRTIIDKELKKFLK